MSEMIDRIASVLAKSGVPQAYATTVARSVVEAIREPSEAMINAGWGAVWIDRESVDVPATWRAMIDAALAEESRARQNPYGTERDVFAATLDEIAHARWSGDDALDRVKRFARETLDRAAQVDRNPKGGDGEAGSVEDDSAGRRHRP
jgi:hypothetical protein